MPPARPHLASLIDTFDQNGREIAVVCTSRLRPQRTPYRELARRARRFAAELEQRGIGKGDRVLLWGENSANWMAVFFGCILRGVLPVPVDAGSALGFVQRVRADVTPRLIVADAERRSLFSEALPLEDLHHLITDHTQAAPAELQPDDPLQIIYTSGTTAEPKGIVHTHANVLASLTPIETEIANYRRYERIFHPLRFLHTLPLSHVFGQFMGLWIPGLLAAEVHYQPRLVAAELIEQIKRERISVCVAVPRVLDLLRRELEATIPGLKQRIAAATNLKVAQRWWHFRDIHRLFGFKFWAFVCGGASLASEHEHFWQALGLLVIQGYGMTETTALVSLNHPFRAARGSVGKVLPGREIQLGADGEVLVRGDTISRLRWQSGAVEAQDTPWLATGDLAELDAEGNLHFRGRKKDLIVTAGGLNIHPEDLEGALSRQPGIRMAAVVEQEAANGPEPLAVIVANPGANIAEAVERANGELADYQQIRRWVPWAEADLPRSSTGKVLRREIVARLAESKGITSGGADEELQLDSLGRVQLQARLEAQYGLTIDDAALQRARTEADVQALVRERKSAVQLQTRDRHLYPRWPWKRPMQFLRGLFLEVVAMPLLRALTKTRRRNIVTRWPHEPALIVCNHITAYDAAFVLYALPPLLRRRVAVAMSGEMMLDLRRARGQQNWFINLVAPLAYLAIVALFNVFPLPQFGGFRRSFRHAGEAMEHGYSVLIFPEGRRSDNGIPLPFKGGAGLLWKELGTPALAVHLAGLGELKATRARWFRSGKVEVSVRALLEQPAGKSPEEMTKMLEAAVFAQNGERSVT